MERTNKEADRMSNNNSLVEVNDLRIWFPIEKGLFSKQSTVVKALDGVSFQIKKGEILGLVGESGSGKTTLGRSVLKLVTPTSGDIRYNGADIADFSGKDSAAFRRNAQLIFQDPFASLNPRMHVEEIIGEPIRIHGLAKNKAELKDKVIALMEMVGLDQEHAQRFPHEFSGGQRQRIGIARALSLEPEFIVADEPVSALDVSIQAQVINLLKELKERLELTILFIAHDLAVVEYIANRIVVMYLGQVMEIAESHTLCRTPKHPYTLALLSAVPETNPQNKRERIILEGDIPSPINPPSGCVFRTRCPYALDACAKEKPTLRETAPGHFSACIRDDLTF